MALAVKTSVLPDRLSDNVAKKMDITPNMQKQPPDKLFLPKLTQIWLETLPKYWPARVGNKLAHLQAFFRNPSTRAKENLLTSVSPTSTLYHPLLHCRPAGQHT